MDPEANAAAMDAFYSVHRHIYDVTRPLFLFGRDRLVRSLNPPAGGAVLEVGCGTARNLVKAARLWPDSRFYGVDISRAMLDTAGASIARWGLLDRINLARADGGTLNVEALFGVANFDRIFFSYALSMMPPWREALGRAVALLRPGGSLHVVDFGQYDRLPAFLKQLHFASARAHHVFPRADLNAVLQRLSAEVDAELQIVAHLRGYAWSATLRRYANDQCQLGVKSSRLVKLKER